MIMPAGLWHRVQTDLETLGANLPLRLFIVILAVAANVGFYLPKVPSAGGVGSVPGLDKVVHVGVFALTVWALGRLLAPVRRFPIGWVALAAFAHAGLIEMIQSVMPNRSADLLDVLADTVGIALGLVLWHLERRRRRQRSQSVARVSSRSTSTRSIEL